jgi:hypothetical protein
VIALNLFLVLEHGLKLVEEDVGVLGLEDEGRTKTNGTFTAAAAVHTLETKFAKNTVASEIGTKFFFCKCVCQGL